MNQKSEDCGCLFPLLPCLNAPSPEDIIRRQRSDEIDRQLMREKAGFKNTHRLLLLGAGESGKSTILKQMQLIHIEKFSEAVKQERRNDIRNNLLDAVVSIISAMPVLSPEVKLERAENRKRIDWILANALQPDFKFPQEFYDCVSALWQDKGVQATFQRSNEYQLIDSAQYFLEKMDTIRRDDYLPSEQDILRCRVLTRGIYELTFHINNFKFQMIDVGGQRGERKKWILCFNEVTAIIFVTASSSYDSALREDPLKNRLQESLDIFKIVWNNRFLKRIPVILFLNKQDIFRKKILAGKSKIEDYFSEYKNFEIPSRKRKDITDPEPEVVCAKYFLISLFENISAVDKRLKTCNDHYCYYHFTCAVDTNNIKRVFEDCRDSIIRQHLVRTDLM